MRLRLEKQSYFKRAYHVCVELENEGILDKFASERQSVWVKENLIVYAGISKRS